jgi:microcystin-dependent protein
LINLLFGATLVASVSLFQLHIGGRARDLFKDDITLFCCVSIYLSKQAWGHSHQTLSAYHLSKQVTHKKPQRGGIKSMADAYMGQIMPWPINYAPQNWAYCWGQTLAISQYNALFSLLGTYYGGDGVTNFKLPDLRGRVAVGAGSGPGLTPYQLGQMGGYEHVSLNANNIPAHTHPTPASSSSASAEAPAPDLAPAKVPRGSEYKLYASPVDANLAPTGNNATSTQPVENRQPLLALNYIICLVGLYPPRS